MLKMRAAEWYKICDRENREKRRRTRLYRQ